MSADDLAALELHPAVTFAANGSWVPESAKEDDPSYLDERDAEGRR